MENMKLCPICHEEVFDNEEIKIQGVPYHEWCYGEEYLDEMSGTAGAAGYSGAAFTLNYPEEDEDEPKDKKKKSAIDEEILQKIDELSSTAGIGNKIVDSYGKDKNKLSNILKKK
jgi:hypothetical protein